MARRTFLVHFDEHGVAVAVQPDLTYPLPVPTGLTFTQYSPRLREKNVERPVVSVLCRARSSIQPTISTSPVVSSWMTAVTSPAASRLSSAATSGSSVLPAKDRR